MHPYCKFGRDSPLRPPNQSLESKHVKARSKCRTDFLKQGSQMVSIFRGNFALDSFDPANFVSVGVRTP